MRGKNITGGKTRIHSTAYLDILIDSIRRGKEDLSFLSITQLKKIKKYLLKNKLPPIQ